MSEKKQSQRDAEEQKRTDAEIARLVAVATSAATSGCYPASSDDLDAPTSTNSDDPLCIDFSALAMACEREQAQKEAAKKKKKTEGKSKDSDTKERQQQDQPFPSSATSTFTDSASSSSSSAAVSQSWLEMKKMGNAYFTRGCYESAVMCFSGALEAGLPCTSQAGSTLFVDIIMLLSAHYTERIEIALKQQVKPSKSVVVAAAKYCAAAMSISRAEVDTVCINYSMQTLICGVKAVGDSSTLAPGGGIDGMHMIKYVTKQNESGAAMTPTVPASDGTTSVLPLEEAVELGNQVGRLLLAGDSSSVKVADLLERALTAFAPRAVLLSNRALCYLKMNKPELALYDTHAALVLDPTQVKAVYRQADAFYQLKEYEAAKSACQHGIKITMNDQSQVTAFVQLARRVAASVSSGKHEPSTPTAAPSPPKIVFMF